MYNNSKIVPRSDYLKIICFYCGDDGPKVNVLKNDVFISYTCAKCKKNIFDLIGEEK
jgi:DNA-directed RNA polymerase subunit RPC12/RpoP